MWAVRYTRGIKLKLEKGWISGQISTSPPFARSSLVVDIQATRTTSSPPAHDHPAHPLTHFPNQPRNQPSTVRPRADPINAPRTHPHSFRHKACPTSHSGSGGVGIPLPKTERGLSLRSTAVGGWRPGVLGQPSFNPDNAQTTNGDGKGDSNHDVGEDEEGGWLI